MSVLLVVAKAGGYGCRWSLKFAEEDEEETEVASACVVAARKFSVDCSGCFIRSRLVFFFYIKRGTKNSNESFSWYKRCFRFISDRILQELTPWCAATRH